MLGGGAVCGTFSITRLPTRKRRGRFSMTHKNERRPVYTNMKDDVRGRKMIKLLKHVMLENVFSRQKLGLCVKRPTCTEK